MEMQLKNAQMSCGFQKRKRVCEQKRKGLEDRNMEDDDGFGFWIAALALFLLWRYREKFAGLVKDAPVWADSCGQQIAARTATVNFLINDWRRQMKGNETIHVTGASG